MADDKSEELEALCAEVARWRAQTGGGRGHRIPRALWQQAIAVARVEGAYKTARATRLKAERLTALMDDADMVSAEHAPARSDNAPFVALQMMGPATRSHSVSVVLQGRHGEVMRIESAGGLDLPALVAAFWSRST
jgi:hypothetical protein